MPKDNRHGPRGVELKKNDDGTSNANYVDLLEEDKPISGQKLVQLMKRAMLFENNLTKLEKKNLDKNILSALVFEGNFDKATLKSKKEVVYF